MERLVLWHRILPPGFGQNETTTVSGPWTKHVNTQVQQAGGQVLLSLAGTVVSAFQPEALEGALQLALRLLAEADLRSQGLGGDLSIAFGVALGEVRLVQEDAGTQRYGGTALDRAQSLANKAIAGEVVLDLEARALAGRTFLFGRVVGGGSLALEGEAIDRTRPLLAECRRAQRHLAPAPLPSSLASALDPVQRAVLQPQSRVFLLHGPTGLGARDALIDLCHALKPPAFFEIESVPGALEPLGGLRLALLRAWRTPERVGQALEHIDPEAGDALEAIACGDPPPRHDALRALKVMLRVLRGNTGVPWFYIERPATVDLATFSLVEQLLHDPEVAFLLFWRARKANVPTWLRGSPSVYQIHIPPLQQSEAASIAAGMLRNILDPDLPKQIASLQPSTRLDVVETVRAMIAAGDIVHDRTGFAWRTGPRGPGVVNTRALIDDRVAQLDDVAARYLEIACAALPASAIAVVNAAAAADGILQRSASDAFSELVEFGMLDERAKPTSEILRRSVMQKMLPARRAHVYRTVAEALRDTEPFAGPCTAATTGAYLCESGAVQDGVENMLTAARTAAWRGYERATNRLVAAAIQYQPTETTREAAAALSQRARDSCVPPPGSVDKPPTIPPFEDPKRPPTVAPPIAPPLATPALRNDTATELVQALRAKDFARVERLIDSAIAGGGSLTTAHCFGAITSIGRNEFDQAQRAIERARSAAGTRPASAIRVALTAAWFHWTRRRYDDATIESLEALALAKEMGDPGAQQAALRMLAAGCEISGRPHDAHRLVAASDRTLALSSASHL